ncbi:retron St85 family RNA-directed DNA polymerase [Clostridium butyricum]|uniref:retron St85 family RNA-directed DNA polymerase n=1 Tax=Clostridium butyricum TaxID=1492 RepID=UPI002ABE5EF8|nr:retron St85 family RNA-directed DNA polymerase [Clostridium butyricum]
MKWETYCNNYTNEAKSRNLDENKTNEYLEYAKILFDKDLPIIYDQYHLSLLVGYKYEYILAASNSSANFYRKFEIPKKNGDMRKISEPLPSLKEIQYWILNEILNKIKVSKYAKAYIKGRSIKENARFHRNQKVVATLDIKDYFPSISVFKIIEVFEDIGYSKSVSVMLANLCCLNNSLPQGAPTSAALSNIVMKDIDDLIVKYTNLHKIRYTRYADDLTFSGDFNFEELLRYVKKLFKKNGFKINSKKTRRFYRDQRQIVTGIVTNEKLQAPKEIRRNLRRDMYYIQKYGLNSHLEKVGNTKNNYLYHLLGIVNFILFVNPKDTDVIKYKEILKKYILND